MNKKLFMLVLSFIVSCAYGMESSISEQQEDDLLDAVILGDTQKVGALINGGVPLNGFSVGRGPLYNAIFCGDVKMFKFLLDKGAPVNDHKGAPLTHAVWYSSPAIIETLIEAGADPLIKNEFGTNAFDEAASCTRHPKSKYETCVLWKLKLKKRDNLFISHFEKLWPKVKLLWLGHRKEQPQNCKLATLPTELICMISDYVWGNKKLECKKWKEGSAKYRKQLEESEAIES